MEKKKRIMRKVKKSGELPNEECDAVRECRAMLLEQLAKKR